MSYLVKMTLCICIWFIGQPILDFDVGHPHPLITSKIFLRIMKHNITLIIIKKISMKLCPHEPLQNLNGKYIKLNVECCDASYDIADAHT